MQQLEQVHLRFHIGKLNNLLSLCKSAMNEESFRKCPFSRLFLLLVDERQWWDRQRGNGSGGAKTELQRVHGFLFDTSHHHSYCGDERPNSLRPTGTKVTQRIQETHSGRSSLLDSRWLGGGPDYFNPSSFSGTNRLIQHQDVQSQYMLTFFNWIMLLLPMYFSNHFIWHFGIYK